MDLKDTFRFVAPRVRDAAVKTAAQLDHLGIRYALAGGLAVGAHGYIRATTDVDFLVGGEEAFDHQGPLVAFKAGVPIEVDGIRIYYLSPTSLGPQMEEVLDHPPISEGLAVVPIEALIYMKLVAKRRKDLVDVVELVKAGADLTLVRNFLRQYACDMVRMFEELVNEALAE
ncbi:MAG: nucleotidyl transferase AbiEii/AbiGii toxin family protein [Chloracidobacterium sp.]|nr:nucleotidyl transferase AbiEii/AbiGii toxin family protein [Chloracidobacterium sp.]